MIEVNSDLIAIAIPLATIVSAGYVFSRSTTSLSKKLDAAENERKELLVGEVNRLIRRVTPRVVHCSGKEEVAREAAALVTEALDLFQQHRQRDVTKVDATDEESEGSKSYKDSDFIAIYGSASLSDHYDEYGNAIHKAVEGGIRLRRYLSLLSPDDLGGRSSSVIGDYEHWLDKQIKELENSSDFELIDNVRAPRWGSSNTTIITNAGVLEIKAHGDTAIAVFDQVIAATMRESLRKEMNDARAGNRTKYSRNSENIGSLRDLLDKIRSLDR